MSRSWLLLYPMLFIFANASAQPDRPILVLNNEMHLSKISSLSITKNKEIALTTSYDKTAKAWSIKEKMLIKTFRIPIGKNDEGSLFAGAISPDGKLVALSGWTGSWENSDCIYLLDFNTGDIINTIKNLPNTVTFLGFSENGIYLVARTTTNSISLYNLKNRVQAQLINSWDNCNQAQFVENELWCLQENKIQVFSEKTNYHESERSYSFQYRLEAFSSGKKMVVGIDGSQRLHSIDLSSQEYKIRTIKSFTPSTKANVIQISISETEVYLAGNYQSVESSEKRFAILRYSLTDGFEESYPLLGNTCINILNLEKNTILAGSTFPDFAILNVQSKRPSWIKSAPVLNVSGTVRSRFKVNKLGTRVSISENSRSEIQFDFKEKLVIEGDSKEEWITPIGLTGISNWYGQKTATVSGRVAAICDQKEERILCYSSNTDQSALFWGTDWNLVKTDLVGTVIWRIPVTEQVVSLLYQPNNNLVVCLIGDGIVRWFDAVSGALQMSLYIEPSTKKWITFTEDGYYDASAGGDNLAGWLINRSSNESPLFYSASRFKDEFFFPRRIEELLGIVQTSSFAQTKNSREINREEIPPNIIVSSSNTITSSVPGGAVEIEYVIVQPKGATLKKFIVQVDGVPLPQNSYKIIENSKLIIPSPPPHCTVTLYAENNFGTSEGRNVFLKLNKANDAVGPKPNLYILSVGISEYQDTKSQLKYAAIDAESFSQLFDYQRGQLYGAVTRKVLLNDKATRSAIQEGFDWLISNTGHNDIAMIFFAGHGINDQRNIYYMAPYEANANSLRSSCLNFEELRQTISLIAGKSICFIDACHSGNVMGSRDMVNMNAVINELSSVGSGNVTFTSSTGKELSYENSEWKHGAFTKAIIEAFEGQGFDGEGKLTIVGLESYISSRVKQLTDGKQHPTRQNSPNIPDFPIALKK